MGGACNEMYFLLGVYSAGQEEVMQNVSGKVFWSEGSKGECR